jgi:hypothetical protein
MYYNSQDCEPCRSRISTAPNILDPSSRGEHTGRHERTAKAFLDHGEPQSARDAVSQQCHDALSLNPHGPRITRMVMHGVAVQSWPPDMPWYAYSLTAGVPLAPRPA